MLQEDHFGICVSGHVYTEGHTSLCTCHNTLLMAIQASKLLRNRIHVHVQLNTSLTWFVLITCNLLCHIRTIFNTFIASDALYEMWRHLQHNKYINQYYNLYILDNNMQTCLLLAHIAQVAFSYSLVLVLLEHKSWFR